MEGDSSSQHEILIPASSTSSDAAPSAGRKKLTERQPAVNTAASSPAIPRPQPPQRAQSSPDEPRGAPALEQMHPTSTLPHVHHPPPLRIPRGHPSSSSSHPPNTPSNTLITAAAGGSSPSTARQHAARSLKEEELVLEEFLHVDNMTAYQSSFVRSALFLLLSVASAGLLALLAHWFPTPFMPWRYARCAMKDAEYVYVLGKQHGGQLVPVIPTTSETDEEAAQRRTNELYQRKHAQDADAAAGAHHLPGDSEPEHGEAKKQKRRQQARAASQRRPEAAQPLIPSPSNVGSGMQRSADRMIVWRHNRFMYDRTTDGFERVRYMSSAPSATLDTRMESGLGEDVAAERQVWYGHNILTIIVPSYVTLLLGEVFHPFYVFQIYSVVLWCFEYYYIFASAIFVIAVVSIVTTLLETRQRLISLSTLAYYTSYVHTLRSGRWSLTSSADLVVGDVVEVTTGIVPCDVALLDGGCVVNESMLTGESIPVVKGNVQWPVNRQSDTVMSLGTDQRSTLFSATKVLQLKPSSPGAKVLGLVVRTGFATTKGSLILSILYPKPSTFKFVEQSYRFIATLFCVALVGFGLTIWQLKVRGSTNATIVIRACDLVTIVVPPTLPLALSVGTNFALVVLKRLKIFCISPSRINMAGKVRLMAFDKTGTLTSEGLEFIGVLGAEAGKFTRYQTEVEAVEGEKGLQGLKVTTPSSTRHQQGTPRRSPSARTPEHGEKKEVEWVEEDEKDGGTTASPSNGSIHAHSPYSYDPAHPYPISRPLLLAMSSCHSLAVLDGQLIGDPLDVQVFQTTRATLQDQGDLLGYDSLIHVSAGGGDGPVTLGVREQFDFVAALQRMSVVVEDASSKAALCYVKGSPEAISSLCVAASIPQDFASVLSAYTHQGYRVIAFAYKALKEPLPHVEKAEKRQLVEKELTFMGLLLLENAVKPETAGTLAILNKAKIRTLMVTGDNPLTAVAVAKECGLVSEGTVVYQSQLLKSLRGEELEWRDTDNANNILDPLTLKPTSAVKPSRWELAVTGPAFAHLQAMAKSSARGSLFHRVLLAGQIFARMLPDQKASLIGELQAMGIYCGFCGDGANDCGALKAAMVGVSLSESEASIAAPFTYQRPNIECVPALLSEGRSSLVTSFQLFRYISMYTAHTQTRRHTHNASALPSTLPSSERAAPHPTFPFPLRLLRYSLTQFGAAILTYFVGSVLGNWQYLYQDLIIVFPLTIFMGATSANRQLSVKRPSAQLTSLTNILGLAGHVGIILSFQVFVFLYTQKQPGYFLPSNPDNTPDAFETTALYYYSNFQYLIVAALFALGRPWKASPLSNRKLTGWWLLMMAVSLVFLLVNTRWGFWRSDDLELNEGWRREMLLVVLINAFASCMWELYWYPGLVHCVKEVRRRGTGGKEGSWYGRRKVVKGGSVKEYYALRGEFEQNWYGGRGDIRVTS